MSNLINFFGHYFEIICFAKYSIRMAISLESCLNILHSEICIFSCLLHLLAFLCHLFWSRYMNWIWNKCIAARFILIANQNNVFKPLTNSLSLWIRILFKEECTITIYQIRRTFVKQGFSRNLKRVKMASLVCSRFMEFFWSSIPYMPLDTKHIQIEYRNFIWCDH